MRLLSFALLGIAFLNPGHASAQKPELVVEKIGGADKLSVRRGGELRILKEKDPLQEGDELSTPDGVAVDFRFLDESLVRIGGSSKLTIMGPGGTDNLRPWLIQGHLRAQVPKREAARSEKARHDFLTPHATAKVTGTEFQLIVSECRTVLQGIDGEVLFWKHGTTETSAVAVKRGFESSAQGCGAKAPAGTAEKFDHKAMLQRINGKDGPYAGLATRASKVYTRATK